MYCDKQIDHTNEMIWWKRVLWNETKFGNLPEASETRIIKSSRVVHSTNVNKEEENKQSTWHKLWVSLRKDNCIADIPATTKKNGALPKIYFL